MTAGKPPSRPLGSPAGTTSDDDARIAAFVAQAKGLGRPRGQEGQRGRLVFALDATASREPTWDRACHLQAEMFDVAAKLGGLDVQLVFYRGFRECRSSKFVADAETLARRMTAVRCLGGVTQIGRVIRHAIKISQTRPVDAVVFVGDAFEEDIDQVCQNAGELGLLGVRMFLFHEGFDPVTERAFRQIARLTRGAYARFDLASAEQLRRLLGAVAAYAAGGRKALADYGRTRGSEVLRISHQIGTEGG